MASRLGAASRGGFSTTSRSTKPPASTRAGSAESTIPYCPTAPAGTSSTTTAPAAARRSNASTAARTAAAPSSASPSATTNGPSTAASAASTASPRPRGSACSAKTMSSSPAKWARIASPPAPVTSTIRVIPAARRSSTTCCATGRSPRTSIALGTTRVAGSIRVPRPATGTTAVATLTARSLCCGRARAPRRDPRHPPLRRGTRRGRPAAARRPRRPVARPPHVRRLPGSAGGRAPPRPRRPAQPGRVRPRARRHLDARAHGGGPRRARRGDGLRPLRDARAFLRRLRRAPAGRRRARPRRRHDRVERRAVGALARGRRGEPRRLRARGAARAGDAVLGPRAARADAGGLRGAAARPAALPLRRPARLSHRRVRGARRGRRALARRAASLRGRRLRRDRGRGPPRRGHAARARARRAPRPHVRSRGRRGDRGGDPRRGARGVRAQRPHDVRRGERCVPRRRARVPSVRPVEAVAGVAEARADVAALVEPLVDRGAEHRHVGVLGRDGIEALGRRHEADEAQPLRAPLLEAPQARRRAAARGEHRVDEHDLGLWAVLRNRLVVADGRERLLVAVHPEVADARLGHEAEEAIHHAEAGPQDRDHDDVVGQSRAPRRLERRLDVDPLHPQVAQRLEADEHRRLGHAAAELARRRGAVTQDAQVAGHQRVVDDGHGHARARYSLGTVSEPRRNLELKALDPDPSRTLERALAAGAEDHGVIVQRDTYLRVARGRLKLREEQPGEAHLIAYRRPDEAQVRVSSYRVAPVPDADATRAALEETLGIDVVVAKRRRLVVWETVRIHLDEVEGLGSFMELEAVAEAGSDLAREQAQVAHLRERLGIGDDLLRDGSYADALRAAQAVGAEPRGAGAAAAPDPELLALAREAAGRAYAPYSNFPVGAAVRTADGRRFAGANVENAAYPQGQCAAASALGAMVAGGGGRVVEFVVAAPSERECPPCGGCSQRLREFAARD